MNIALDTFAYDLSCTTPGRLKRMINELPYEATWGADVLDDTDWPVMLSAYADGMATCDLLRGDADAGLVAHLLSAVVHQGTLFPVAEPVARFLLPLCLERADLHATFEPFWREWLEGVDQVKVEYEVTSAMHDKALDVVRSCAGDENALESLYDDPSPGTPMSVLHNYTYQQAALVRRWVVPLVSNK